MMRHLTPADYRRMPWANGRGVTVELWREEVAGQLSLRLSMATVAEDGPFSLFPGIDRVLTVISGPGFDLLGEGLRLRADLLCPVAFPGDVALAAVGVTGSSEDFNVMTARGGLRAGVEVLTAGGSFDAKRVFVFALGPTDLLAEGTSLHLSTHDLVETAGRGLIEAGGPVLAAALDG
ncbi:MAG: HutD family protein [Rhodobacteraceae bacterium]|nr:HutD family protein [Paracoccaceae bacterium]